MEMPTSDHTGTSGAPHPERSTWLRILRGRFTALTILLLTLSLLGASLPEGDLRTVVVDLAFSVLLLFAVRTVGRRGRVATIAFAVPAFFAHWALYLVTAPVVRGLAFACSVAFLAFLTFVVLAAVMREQEVTADTVVGGICAYFLIGITWGNAYALVELLAPGSFLVSSTLAAETGWHPPDTPISPVLQYFSLTTLTTIGFGDVTPLSSPARTLAVLEGVVGQLYLTVLIARLVGIHTARSTGG